jgi:hypothetical protein
MVTSCVPGTQHADRARSRGVGAVPEGMSVAEAADWLLARRRLLPLRVRDELGAWRSGQLSPPAPLLDIPPLRSLTDSDIAACLVRARALLAVSLPVRLRQVLDTWRCDLAAEAEDRPAPAADRRVIA